MRSIVSRRFAPMAVAPPAHRGGVTNGSLAHHPAIVQGHRLGAAAEVGLLALHSHRHRIGRLFFVVTNHARELISKGRRPGVDLAP